MKIGDLVIYQGRAHYLRGLEPMSVPDRNAILEDAETGEQVTAPLAEVEPAPDGGSGLTEV
jgi:hypothetical protein